MRPLRPNAVIGKILSNNLRSINNFLINWTLVQRAE